MDVTARCRDADEVLLVDDCVDVLLWAAVLLLAAAAVVLLVAVELLVAAAAAVVLLATAGALESVVATAVEVSVDAWLLPNASHPPSVPTIAAVAIADFKRAISCLRCAVSGCAIAVLP